MTDQAQRGRVTTAAEPVAVIVGGGIAGLTAALRLSEQLDSAGAPGRVMLLEAADYLGGRIRTVQRPDGLMAEWGPEGFVGNKPWAMQLMRDLGLADELIWLNQEGGPISQLLRDGEMFPLPNGVAHVAITDPQVWVEAGLITESAAERLRAEPDVPPRMDDDDESVQSFFVRRFGQEPFDQLIGPLLRGIAGESDTLSMQATMPELRVLERREGSVIKGINKQKAAVEAQGREFDIRVPLASPRRGMQRIVDEIVARLEANPRVELRTGVRVQRVETAGDGFRVVTDGGPIEAASVLLALPAPVAAGLVQEAAPDLTSVLREFGYRPGATVSLAFRADDIAVEKPGMGYVKHHTVPGPVNACTWDSRRWLGRAPQGVHVLRVFFREEPLEQGATEDDLVRMAREDLNQVLGIDAEPIFTVAAVVAPNGLARYPLGHDDRIRRLKDQLAALPGLQLAGGYDGAGVTDAMGEGERAGKAMAERLVALVSA